MNRRIPPNAVSIKERDSQESASLIRSALRTLFLSSSLEIITHCAIGVAYYGGVHEWFSSFLSYDVYESFSEYQILSLLKLIFLFIGYLRLFSKNVYTLNSMKGKCPGEFIVNQTSHSIFLTLAGSFILLLLKSRHLYILPTPISAAVSIVSCFFLQAYSAFHLSEVVALHAKDRFVLSALNTYATDPVALERVIFPPDEVGENPFSAPVGAQLSARGLFKVLRPFFWPQTLPEEDEEEVESSSSSSSNDPTLLRNDEEEAVDEHGVVTRRKKESPRLRVWRLRMQSVGTWLCVLGSKGVSVATPLVMGALTRALVDGEAMTVTLRWIILWGILTVSERGLKELQGVLYLPVKQEAAVELRRRTFSHLVEDMGYEWHVRRKLGPVNKAIDRGAWAASTITTNGFLVLVPAVIEACVISAVFLFLFKSTALSATVIGGVFAYIYLTIQITSWRRQLRVEANKRDNKVQDVLTDCLVNIDTVRTFANERNEVTRFASQVKSMLTFSTQTERMLALLNLVQNTIVTGTTCAAFVLCAYAVQRGQMDVGDFTTLTAYTAKVFAPFVMLGGIYNQMVQAFTDIKNLSQLLAMQSNVRDKENAPHLVKPSVTASSSTPLVAVEFDNVQFAYSGAKDGQAAATGSLVPSADARKSVRQLRTMRDRKLHVFRADLDVDEDIQQRPLLASSRAVVDSQDPNTLTAALLAAESGDAISSSPSLPPPSSGLRGVSFKILEGQTVGIVGHTGAGKTTLTRLLLRFLDPTEGSVRVYGKDLRDVTQTSVRGSVLGVVPQDCVLFNDSILYNILYGSRDIQRLIARSSGTGNITTAFSLRKVLGDEKFKEVMQQVHDVCEAAQLMPFIEKSHQLAMQSAAKSSYAQVEYAGEEAHYAKWDTMVGERGLKLSGGEKQRVSIARCLLKNPQILIFDEATSALDTQTELLVQKAIDGLANGSFGGVKRTCMVIAHRLSTVRKADNIIVLHNGRVVEAGSHDRLMSAPAATTWAINEDVVVDPLRQMDDGEVPLVGIYRRLWEMQLKGMDELKGDDDSGVKKLDEDTNDSSHDDAAKQDRAARRGGRGQAGGPGGGMGGGRDEEGGERRRRPRGGE